MAITQGTLGAGRPGLRKLFAIEMDKLEKQYIDILGRTDSTTLTTEVYKQYAGLGPSQGTPEGDKVVFDDVYPLYVGYYKPTLYTIGVQMSKQTKFTDQYNKLRDMTPDIARSMLQRRNLNAADLDNSGFSDTAGPNGNGYGIDGVALYSGKHQMGSYYGANRPLAPGTSAGASPTYLDLALSPLALEYCWKDIRRQKSARNLPMFPIGKLDLKVPPELYLPACRALKASQLAGTNNNDPNEIKSHFNDPKNIDYYTSSTAWFVKASDPKFHGLFFLEQMPYDIEELPVMDDLMIKKIAYESWVIGSYDWHGTWATQGA